MRTIIVVVAMIGLSGCGALPPSPRTYHDCVLAYVKPGMSNEAVRIACAACREKFPLASSAVDPTDHDRELLTAALRYAETLNRAGKARGLAVGMKQSELYGMARDTELQARALEDSAFISLSLDVAKLYLAEHRDSEAEDCKAYVRKTVDVAFVNSGVMRTR